MTNIVSEIAAKVETDKDEHHLVRFEKQLNRELNALPVQLRKMRVQQLRMMRRFAGPACHHPKEREIRRVFPSYRGGRSSAE